MSNILFICDFYYPNATSIGVCTHKVAKKLKKLDNEVHVLTFGDVKIRKSGVYDDISYFNIKKRFHERCADFGKKTDGILGKAISNWGKIKCRLWQLLWFPFFRMDGLRVPLRYYRAISNLHKKHHYDIIVATYNPFEGMLASYWFKKKHPDVTFMLYILDTLTNIGRTSFISKELNDYMGWKWEKRIFPFCDKIITLRCHENHHLQKRYDLFRNKLTYSDIPFLEENIAENGYFNSKYTNFVYTGRILSRLGSSTYASSLFEKLSRDKPYILHYFSSGDEEDIIKDYESKTNGKILQHGLVPHEEVAKIQKSADVLISFGNIESDKIASKIFEYISTGKRIIHFQKSSQDTSTSYYKKYANALIIDERDSEESNIEKIRNFLSSEYSNIEFSILEKMFPENLPPYTANLIQRSNLNEG